MDAEQFGRSVCVAVDVEAYSKRIESEQSRLQSDLTHIVTSAGSRAGLNTDMWVVQQQGDGQLILARPEGNEPRYVDAFVRQLVSVLVRHNRDLVPEARIRMRVAIHHGVAYPGANGFVGDAPILVCRLLDAQVCRDVLAESTADLVLILSTSTYDDIVMAEHTTFSPTEFTKVAINETKARTDAWIWCPSGHDSETLQQARARKTSASHGRQNPQSLLGQRAETITNVDTVNADYVHFGTSIRHDAGPEDRD